MNVGDTERGSPPPPLVSLPQQGENLSLSPPRRSRSRSLQFRRSATGASNRSVENSSRRSNASKRSREKIQATETAARLELNRHLANLQLPRMPASIVSHGGEPIKDGDGSTQSHHDQQSTSEPPTIRILVVADIDLDSASALAESALNNSHEENLLKGVDLCIACGPFCQEDDLRFYYQGRQRRRHMARHSKAHHAKTHSAAPIWRGGNGNALLPLPPMPQHMHSKRQNTSRTMQTPCAPAPTSSYPFKRTKEETAALEGLMTAALSQLESIVCRVVFVPGKSDPVTTITSSLTSVAYTKERRLTPNSRNIHQHWIPLCPGLGCAGLLYVDGQKLQQQPPPLADDDDDEGDDDDDDETDTSHLLREDSSVSYDREDHPSSVPVSPAASPDLLPLSNDIDNSSDVTTFEQRVQDYGSEFCRQLNDLVNLAPPIQAISDSTSHDSPITDLIQTERFQSILVTHFHHLETDVSISESENKDSHRDDDGSIHFGDNDDVEEEDEQESFDPPWPSDHEGFCALPQVQEHVLLEIAAGCNSKGRTIKPMELPKGRLRVVLPGSLRERGEFCVVDVSFMKMTGAAAVSSKHEDYRWIVRRTRFHTINDYY